jgi:hypothetical protein
MTKAPKKPRYVKAAKRVLKALSKPSIQPRVSRVKQRSPIEQQEEESGNQRQARREDTKRCNADAQELPRSNRFKQTNPLHHLKTWMLSNTTNKVLLGSSWLFQPHR